MGGFTIMVLHLLAAATEAGVNFKMADIDQLSWHIPVCVKLHRLRRNIIWKMGSIHAELGKCDKSIYYRI